jgi:hypothetical protein
MLPRASWRADTFAAARAWLAPASLQLTLLPPAHTTTTPTNLTHTHTHTHTEWRPSSVVVRAAAAATAEPCECAPTGPPVPKSPHWQQALDAIGVCGAQQRGRARAFSAASSSSWGVARQHHMRAAGHPCTAPHAPCTRATHPALQRALPQPTSMTSRWSSRRSRLLCAWQLPRRWDSALAT